MVPSYLTYYHFFATQRVGYGAAIATVQMVMTLVLGRDLPALPGATIRTGSVGDGRRRRSRDQCANATADGRAARRGRRTAPARWLVLAADRWRSLVLTLFPFVLGAHQRRQDRAPTTRRNGRCRFPTASIRSTRSPSSGTWSTSRGS